MISWDKTWSLLENSVRSSLKSAVTQLPNLIAGVIVLLLVALVVWIYKKVAHRILGRYTIRQSLQELILTFGKVLLWTIGIVAAATLVFPGISPSKILGAAGLASVAVGLAFKDIFQNFFAGILLLWRFPFEPGDIIESGDVKGKVIDTRLRMTTVRALSGELIIVPNSQLIANPLDVLTDQDLRRTEIQTGVAYKEDLPQAIEVITKALQACETLVKDKPHDVFASGFGASSMDIDIIYWTSSSPYEMRRSRAEVVTKVKSALDEARIEIPFPYRTLTFDEPLKTMVHNSEEKN